MIYQEAHLPSLLMRFHIETVQTFLKIYASPQRRSQCVFIIESATRLNYLWHHSRFPQVFFRTKAIAPIKCSPVCEVVLLNAFVQVGKIEFDVIFQNNDKHLRYQYLNGILEEHHGTRP